MNQNKIYDYLMDKRKKGDDSFFSTKEIHLMLNLSEDICATYRKVNRLWTFKLLEHDSEQAIIDFLNHKRREYKYRARL